jgi:hypothetical protein
MAAARAIEEDESREPFLALPEPEEIHGQAITEADLDRRNRRLYWHLKESQAVHHRRQARENKAVWKAIDQLLDPWGRMPPRATPEYSPRVPVKLLDLPASVTPTFLKKVLAFEEIAGAEIAVPAAIDDETFELVCSWAHSHRSRPWWLEAFWLESTPRWARGVQWANRQHMLWGLSWPLPVGTDALAWWAESRKAVGWAGLPYSSDGEKIEQLSDVAQKPFIDHDRPLRESESADADTNVDTLPLPRRDFPPDAWLGLAIRRGDVWLYGTIDHTYGLDDHVYNRPRRGELRFGKPLPGWPLKENLAYGKWAALRKWYGDTFEGRDVDWGGKPRGPTHYTTVRLNRMESAVRALIDRGIPLESIDTEMVGGEVGLSKRTIGAACGPRKNRESVRQIVKRLRREALNTKAH